MRHKDSEHLQEVDQELVTAVLDLISPEEMTQHLTPQQRLQGLSAEQVVGALSEDELARLRDLLNRKRRPGRR